MKQETQQRRRMVGTVLRNAQNKTVVVRVDRTVTHPKYHKRYTASKKYKAHDEGNLYKAGDVVIIEECRPLSRDKRWRVLKRKE